MTPLNIVKILFREREQSYHPMNTIQLGIKMKTTFLKKRADMPSGPIDRCHDGNGAINWIGVLDAEAPGGKRLQFIHDDILPPGTSVGVHRHTDDQEYYYIVSGRGVMTLDGQDVEVAAGDITAVFPGGSHGLKNDSNEDLRIMVISIPVGDEERQPREGKRDS